MIDGPEICISAIGQDQVRLLPVDHGTDAHSAYMSAIEVLLSLSTRGTSSSAVKDLVLFAGSHREPILRFAIRLTGERQISGKQYLALLTHWFGSLCAVF